MKKDDGIRFIDDQVDDGIKFIEDSYKDSSRAVFTAKGEGKPGKNKNVVKYKPICYIDDKGNMSIVGYEL